MLRTEHFPKFAGAVCSREEFVCVNNARVICIHCSPTYARNCDGRG